jgi:serine/threonine protein kinase, bacterial
MTPQRIGSHYLLHEQIGQGGMGAVWRAEDVEAGIWRAIKVLRPEYARDPVAVARFVRERNALLALRHPNVVTLHDMIVEGDRLALVMDLLTEGDLDKFRRDHGGTLPPGLAAEWVAQACDGLAAAHATGIVHRDLKPGNVLTDQGRARLTDFGIARIGGESPVTTAGTVAGTVSYMAPEALAGAEPAPACDVYAAGVTLYELLAGRPPFTGQAAMVIHDHLHAAPQRPDGLPGPLWQVITACLAKDPAARPTAAQLAAALRAPQLPGGETPAHPARPPDQETAHAPALNPGPHTIAGIGWLSPAGPVPRGPVPPGAVPPGAVPPGAAGEPANRNAPGKRRRICGIAAALVVVAAGAGTLAANMPGSAATPEANSVTAPPATGQATPAATGHSSSPTPTQSKAASSSSGHPASPASSPSAAVPSADTAGSGAPSAGATSASAPPAPAPSASATSAATAAAPAPTPSATTLSGKTVTDLRVEQVFPATNGNNGAVQVSWNQVPGATSYTVYMSVKGSFSTDRTLANEGDLSPGSHEIMITPEPGGKGSSVSFTVPKK